MKKLAVLVLLLFGAISMNAQSIKGSWNTGKENTIVKVEKVSSQFEGKLHASDNAKATEGKPIIEDFKKKRITLSKKASTKSLKKIDGQMLYLSPMEIP